MSFDDAQHPYLIQNCFYPILSVEQTSFAMESVRDTQTMVAAMQTAAKQLKVEHKKININQIEDMQDDLSGEDPSFSFSFLHALHSHVSLYANLVTCTIRILHLLMQHMTIFLQEDTLYSYIHDYIISYQIPSPHHTVPASHSSLSFFLRHVRGHERNQRPHGSLLCCS